MQTEKEKGMDALFGLDRVSPHDEGLELLTTVYDRAQLLIVESILKDAEIPYLAKERGSGTMVKVIAGYSMFGTDIFVPRSVIDVAVALIMPHDAQENEEESEEELFAEYDKILELEDESPSVTLFPDIEKVTTLREHSDRKTKRNF